MPAFGTWAIGDTEERSLVGAAYCAAPLS